MSYIDIGIIVVLVLALVSGWWRGFLRPLITWAFVVAGVAVSFGDPSLATRFAPSQAWRPFMGLLVIVVFALAGFVVARLLGTLVYRRIRVVSGLDRLAGVVLSLALSLVAIFVVLCALTSGSLSSISGVHTQIVDSRIAPVIYNAGQRVPYLGTDQVWPSG